MTEDAGSAQQVSQGIIKDSNGVFRWAYEMNMWKNPTLVITAWKVMFLAALFPALLMFMLTLVDGDGLVAALDVFIRVLGIAFAIVTGILLLAYPLVAFINGGIYCVVFEMDDYRVKHIQMQKQFKKSQVLSMIVVLAGALAKNPQTAGAGLLSGSKQSLLSNFDQVKTIVVREKRNVIYLNESLTRNQVYADAADFAFIRDYIISCCKKARVSYK
ncbi:MAG: hypothetical protein U1E11_06905 [Dethiobacteria bacterium]|nr:hypothetical protein [Dethiobacteria bacterium]